MQARGLTLERAGQRLIDGIDLDLTPNGITMVMGFNGAGKSLLLRLLHGMIEPTSGTVAWAGRPLDLSLRRRQAMVFQRPVLLRRSVRANIDFALSLKTGSGHWNHETLLFHVGLLEKANQPARLLSGGEQQRLALARALAIEPDILFLDEPTASLDPASILLIEEIVQRAHGRGTKTVFVTHDIGQARRLADDIVFLHRGKLAERAPAVRFLTNPSSPAGQAYLEGRLFV